VSASGERGLLGLAFDPNYRTNHTFYVDYIDSEKHNTQIARFTASPSNPNVASPNGTTILTIPQPDLSNHKAGWIGFRPGDKNDLYIATGDGGGANDLRLLPNGKPDPNFDNNAQNTNRLLGKILRIDVQADQFPNDPKRNYAIPADNPFASGGGAPEVWDYGLRNPFRNSFDRTKGNLIIADVGQDTREEIDFESASNPGANNYGWRVREGKIQNPAFPNEQIPANARDPVYDYTHGGGTFQGETVIGGYVYRGSFLKGVQGEYFFADFISGKIWSMDTDPMTGALLPDTVRDRTAELKRLNHFSQITSFGEDGFGNLYIVDFSGRVFAVVPEPSTCAMLLIALMPLAWRVARGARVPRPPMPSNVGF